MVEHAISNEFVKLSSGGTWVLHLEYISGCLLRIVAPLPSLLASTSLSETTADHTVVYGTGSSRVQLKLFALPRTADSVLT